MIHRSQLVAIALAGMLLAACIPDTGRPETCDEPSVALEVTLVEERLEPGNPAVCQGQDVTITVDVQRDGILHLHGYDDVLPAREVRAGTSEEFVFTAGRIGEFVIALHTTDGPAEATAGVLTVHER